MPAWAACACAPRRPEAPPEKPPLGGSVHHRGGGHRQRQGGRVEQGSRQGLQRPRVVPAEDQRGRQRAHNVAGLDHVPSGPAAQFHHLRLRGATHEARGSHKPACIVRLQVCLSKLAHKRPKHKSMNSSGGGILPQREQPGCPKGLPRQIFFGLTRQLD